MYGAWRELGSGLSDERLRGGSTIRHFLLTSFVDERENILSNTIERCLLALKHSKDVK